MLMDAWTVFSSIFFKNTARFSQFSLLVFLSALRSFLKSIITNGIWQPGVSTVNTVKDKNMGSYYACMGQPTLTYLLN